MLRRTAILATLLLPLAGCVTYQVADRGSYYEVAQPYPSYADDGYGGGRYAYDEYGYEGYGTRYIDPYDQWFYGWRGHTSPWFVSVYPGNRWYGGIHYSRGWGYSPWAWGYSSWGYSPWASWARDPWAYGYGSYYAPPVRHRPRPQPAPSAEPRPMPKPFVRSVGPEVAGPVIRGPAIGGEALRPAPRAEAQPVPQAGREPMPEARPMPKPRPVMEEGIVLPDRSAPRSFDRRPMMPPRDDLRRNEPRWEEPRAMPRMDREPPPAYKPREEPRQPERFMPREARPEPRFERPEPREEPRFERLEPREEPRFERPEPREEPRRVDEIE